MSVLVQTPIVQTSAKLKPLQSVENLPPTTLITRSEVKHHCDATSCWIIVDDKVYDVTKFLELHPGSEEIILEYGGGEASGSFWDKGHSKHAVRMLQQYHIGDLLKGPHVSDR